MTRFARAALAAAVVACGNAWAAGEATHKPEVVERVDPIYPIIARGQEIAGKVVAWAYLDAEGNVTRTRIRASPHELLSDAVETALRKWKFRPARKDGVPVATTVEYEFVFNLRDPGRPSEGALPPPDAATVSRYVAALAGAEAFRTVYWRESGHKAFASGDDGSWGWSSRRSSPEQAVQAAQDTCDRGRQALTRTCRIVDIDGKWQAKGERTATPFRMLSPFEITAHRRDAVEAWQEDKKARALPLMDQCRVEADRFVPIWKSQDIDAIYRAVAQDLRDQYTRAEFEGAVATIRNGFGLMGQSTFSSQSLLTRWGDDDLRLDLHTAVEYSITASAWQGGGLVLSLVLSPEAGVCRVSALQYLPTSAPATREPERGT